MLSMPLRKQGGAAIVTIPPSVLKSLDLKIGSELQMDVRDGALVLVPVQAPKHQRAITNVHLQLGADFQVEAFEHRWRNGDDGSTALFAQGHGKHG